MSAIDGLTRARIVEAAREWLGTPYRHQGARRGVGCDCLGLVRGVWRDVYGADAEAPGAYRPDWSSDLQDDRLIEAAERHCGGALPSGQVRAGDLLLFRWKAGLPVRHLGIASDESHFIHAYEGMAVVESPLVPAWRRRIAARFAFPDIN
jgi:NlpC/P60 family putative phage cell wall peptidase